MIRYSMLLLAAALFNGSAFAQASPAINWGSAGTVEAPKLPDLPREKTATGDSGFDCRTRTRLSMEYGSLDRDAMRPGPSTVRSCSRDGLTIEVAPLSN